MERTISTDNGTFIVRAYTDADEDQVRSLWQIAFEKEMPLSLWRWKYRENPFRNSQVLCVDPGGTVAVMFGGISYPAMLNDQRVEVVHLMDVMAHPDYRGWLYIKTVKAFMDICVSSASVSFIYGLAGYKSFVIGKRMANHRRLPKELQYMTARPENLKRKRGGLGYRLYRIGRTKAEFDTLWRKCAEVYPFSVVRDRTFLQWRFFDHPQNKYDVWVVSGLFPGMIKGYAVVSREGNRARVVDVFCLPQEKALIHLWSGLGEQLYRLGVESIETWLPADHFLTQSALSVGFSPSPEPLGIIPMYVDQGFHPGINAEWASSRLFHTMADGDLF